MSALGPVLAPFTFGPYNTTNNFQSARNVEAKARRADALEAEYPTAKRARRSFSTAPKDSTGRQAGEHLDTSSALLQASRVSRSSQKPSPDVGSSRNRARPAGSFSSSRSSLSPKTRMLSIVSPGKDAFENHYTPEQLFVMLKGVEFTGKLPSVGLVGPQADDHDIEVVQGGESSRSRKRASSRAVKQDIWTDEAEFAFLAAELYIPQSSASKVMFLNKPCGRNEIIGLVVTMALGKLMTRKQVSSHLQVVRQRKRMRSELKLIFEQDDFAGGVTQGSPCLRGINPRLNDIMGLDRTCDLSYTPKPVWVVAMEGKGPKPSVTSSRERASISGGSTAEDHAMSSGSSDTHVPKPIQTVSTSAHTGMRADVRLHRSQGWEAHDGSDGENVQSDEYSDSGRSVSSSGESSAIYPETSSSAGAALPLDIRIVGSTTTGWNGATSASPPFHQALSVPSGRREKQAGDVQSTQQIERSLDLDGLSLRIGQKTVSLCGVDIGSIQSRDIPTREIRFADDLSRTFPHAKLFHATIEGDPALLSRGPLDFDLRISSIPKDASAPRPLTTTISATSGYLECYNGFSDHRPHALDLAHTRERDRSSGLAPPWTKLDDRIQVRTTERILPELLREQIAYEVAVDEAAGVRRAVDAVLPYFWTVHSVSLAETSRSSGDLVIIYTYVAAAPGSMTMRLDRVERDG